MATRHGPLITRLLAVVAGAFVFAFALVPLYNVLCEATGLNGKTVNRPGGFAPGGLQTNAAPQPAVDTSRRVTVEFTGTVMPGLPWEMRPLTFSIDTHPGEMQLVRYLVRNPTDRTITAQAVPSVTPGQAAQHFEKIDCFCFRQQTLAPGESREMPLAFVVRPDIDRDIRQITLSYAFFGVDGPRQVAAAAPEVKP